MEFPFFELKQSVVTNTFAHSRPNPLEAHHQVLEFDRSLACQTVPQFQSQQVVHALGIVNEAFLRVVMMNSQIVISQSKSFFSPTCHSESTLFTDDDDLLLSEAFFLHRSFWVERRASQIFLQL